MRISRVLAVEGLGGYFFDDEAAIKKGAVADGFAYRGQPVTPGYPAVRSPAWAVCVALQLEDGQVAYGDCVWTQYAGSSGRDPLLSAAEVIETIRRDIAPKLCGTDLGGFKGVAEEIDRTRIGGKQLNSAIRYGVTAALLDAEAKSQRRTMAEVIADEFGLPLADSRIPMWAQCGDDWYDAVDKIILRGIEVMPEPVVNTPEKFARLLDHVHWLKERIESLGGEDYHPRLFYVLCGTMGDALGPDNLKAMVDFCREISARAGPYEVILEDPIVMRSKADQLRALRSLRGALRDEGIGVKLFADEWAITLEDRKEFVAEGATDIMGAHHPNDLGGVNNAVEIIRFSRANGAEPVVGATCCETERSAQLRAHLALATQPSFMLVAPGLGVDEGMSIIHNEMQRTRALLGWTESTRES